MQEQTKELVLIIRFSFRLERKQKSDVQTSTFNNYLRLLYS